MNQNLVVYHHLAQALPWSRATRHRPGRRRDRSSSRRTAAMTTIYV